MSGGGGAKGVEKWGEEIKRNRGVKQRMGEAERGGWKTLWKEERSKFFN